MGGFTRFVPIESVATAVSVVVFVLESEITPSVAEELVNVSFTIGQVVNVTLGLAKLPSVE